MNNKKKLAIVTGGTSGFGLELVKKLTNNYFVIFTARNIDKTKNVYKEISENTKDEVKFFLCEFESLNSVKKAAEEISQFVNKMDLEVDLLIHNAGASAGKKIITEDGYLYEIQVNAFSTILLNEILIKDIKKNLLKNCNIVFIVSSLYQKADFSVGYSPDDSYDPIISYSNAKFIEIYYANMLIQRIKNLDVKVILYSPGYIKTNFFRNDNENKFKNIYYYLFLKNPSKIANNFFKVLKKENKIEKSRNINYIWLRSLKRKIIKTINKNKINEKIVKDINKFLYF